MLGHIWARLWPAVLFVGAIMVVMAETTRLSVGSSVADWLRPFGLQTPPDWLTGPAADRWVFWVGVTLMLVVVARFGWALVGGLAAYWGEQRDAFRPRGAGVRRGSASLAIEFREIGGDGSPLSEFYQSARCVTPEPPAATVFGPGPGAPGAAVFRRVAFLVRNTGDETVRDVRAFARRIVHPPAAREPAVSGCWPLPPLDGAPEPAEIAPGDTAAFMLLELAEPLVGEAHAHHLRTDAWAAEVVRVAGNGLEAYVGGLDRGRSFVRADGVRIGVAVHGRDTPPSYGWFHADLRRGFRVRFRPARSL